MKASLSTEWLCVPLRDICERTETTDPTRQPEEPFLYVDVSSVDNEALEITSVNRLVGSQAPSRARKLIKSGDVIFATVRPTLRRIALVPPELDGQICSTGFCVLRARPTVLDSKFLFFSLQTEDVFLSVEALQDGATYPAIRDGDLLTLSISLPSLEFQEFIARSLQSTRDAIACRRRELALERERKAALMHHLFTHGSRWERVEKRTTRFGDVPNNWRELRLDEAAHIQSGITMGRNFNGAETVMKPYLRVANVQDGYLDLSEIKEIEVLESEVDRYRLKRGDVVLTEGGDFDKLGRGFIWHDQVPDCVHQNHIFAVRANPNIVSPEFLTYLIQSHRGKAYFLSVAHRTTNLASINSTKLKAFPLVVPDRSEQEAIVDALKTCDGKLRTLQLEDQHLTDLFDALLDGLMSGQVPIGSSHS